MKTKVFSLLLVAFVAISSMAVAQPNYGNQKRAGQQKQFEQRRVAEKRTMYANFFTQEQKEQMKQLRLGTAKKVKPLKNEMRELQARQKTLTTADKADMGAINKNIEKISEVRTEMAKIMAAQHQAVRSMLDEEQLLKFDQMQDRKRGKGMRPGRSGGQRGPRS